MAVRSGGVDNRRKHVSPCARRKIHPDRRSLRYLGRDRHIGGSHFRPGAIPSATETHSIGVPGIVTHCDSRPENHVLNVITGGNEYSEAQKGIEGYETKG